MDHELAWLIMQSTHVNSDSAIISTTLENDLFSRTTWASQYQKVLR